MTTRCRRRKLGLMSLMGWLINHKHVHTFYLTHMAALGIILTINHRRDRKGKREGDRWAESMCPSVCRRGFWHQPEMKEQGSLLAMLGFPTVDILQRYNTSLSGYAACFGGRYDSSSCSYATQKHESGSVSHKFNPFQQMDINQIGLVGSNNTSSGSNTKAWCNNDSEVQWGERGSGPLIKHDFTKFKLQRQN